MTDISLPLNTTDLMTDITNGTHVDTEFAGLVSSAETQVGTLASQLSAISIPNVDFSAEIGHLTSIGSDAFSSMSSFIGDNIHSVLDNANLHQTLSSVEGALGQAGSGMCPGLDKAFGPFLAGRSMLSSLSTLQAKIPQLAGLGQTLQSAETALHTAEAQLAQGVQGVTQEFVAGLASAHSAAQGALQDVTSAITTHTGQISSIMGGIHGAIDDANNFVNSATAKLTTFTSALKLNALFKDPCIKSVLGAVASASTLSKLI